MHHRLAQFLALMAQVGFGELCTWRKGTLQPKWLQAFFPWLGWSMLPLAKGEALWMTLGVFLAVFVAWKRTPLALATVVFTGGLMVVYLLGSHPSPVAGEFLGASFAVPLPLLLATALGPRVAASGHISGIGEKKLG